MWFLWPAGTFSSCSSLPMGPRASGSTPSGVPELLPAPVPTWIHPEQSAPGGTAPAAPAPARRPGAPASPAPRAPRRAERSGAARSRGAGQGGQSPLPSGRLRRVAAPLSISLTSLPHALCFQYYTPAASWCLCFAASRERGRHCRCGCGWANARAAGRGAALSGAERSGEERSGTASRPPAPAAGSPGAAAPPRAGSAAMEPPAGFACVLLCCALCLPAAAPRRPGHRGRCAPGPAAVRRLRAARFALSPPEGAGQPARLKSRLRAPRFAAPPELLLRALLPGFQLRAAGEDGDRDRDGDANGDAERRRRHRAVPALPPLPDLHGAGLGPGVPGAGWNTWQLVYLLLLSPPRPPPPSWSPRAAAGTAAGCCPRRPRPQPAHPRRAAGTSSDTQPYRLAVCTPGPSPDPPSAPETAPRPLSIAALPGSPSAPRGLGYGSRDSAAWPGARGPAGGRAGSGSCPLLWGAKASLNELCTLRAGEPSACTGQCPFALCKCLLC